MLSDRHFKRHIYLVEINTLFTLLFFLFKQFLLQQLANKLWCKKSNVIVF